MMDLCDIQDKCSRMLDALEAAPDTLWIHHTLVDCVGSLAAVVDDLGEVLVQHKLLNDRCNSLEKRYSELLYTLTCRDK